MFLLFVVSAPSELSAKTEVDIYIEYEKTVLDEPLFEENDRLYAPVRFIAEHMGAGIVWHQKTNKLEMNTPVGDKLVFTPDDYQMSINGKEYIMDVVPLMKDDRIYLPIRHVAEFMHMSVSADMKNNRVSFTTIPLYIVQEGEDTLDSLSKQWSVSADLIKERNGLTDETDKLAAGQMVKVVIPGIMKEKLPHPDLYLLAQLIFVESGYEPLKGQIAVGNVIMNRVEDSRFPDTIRDVIFQTGQFPPALNGELAKIKPSEDALSAAQRAIDGENFAKGALYFFNPKHANAYMEKLSVVINIGNHRFVK